MTAYQVYDQVIRIPDCLKTSIISNLDGSVLVCEVCDHLYLLPVDEHLITSTCSHCRLIRVQRCTCPTSYHHRRWVLQMSSSSPAPCHSRLGSLVSATWVLVSSMLCCSLATMSLSGIERRQRWSLELNFMPIEMFVLSVISISHSRSGWWVSYLFWGSTMMVTNNDCHTMVNDGHSNDGPQTTTATNYDSNSHKKWRPQPVTTKWCVFYIRTCWYAGPSVILWSSSECGHHCPCLWPSLLWPSLSILWPSLSNPWPSLSLLWPSLSTLWPSLPWFVAIIVWTLYFLYLPEYFVVQWLDEHPLCEKSFSSKVQFCALKLHKTRSNSEKLVKNRKQWW